MSRKSFLSLAAALALIAVAHCPAVCAQGATTTLEEVARAGPFVADTRHRQRFFSQFKLSASDLAKPLTLVINNGFDGKPGFNWIRALIGADMDTTDIKGATEPSADLLFDENYIQRHTVTIDLTGKVMEGVNTIIIEGTAPKGAVMSWVLQGPVTPEFAAINPTTAQAGGRLTLSGRGFSVDPSENHVSIAGSSAQIIFASRTSLTVKVPDHLTDGQADVVVTTNNVRSAPYTISIGR